MVVLAIDPGPEQSAWVLWDGSIVTRHGKQSNEWLRDGLITSRFGYPAAIVIEEIASYGMPVGAEVFETVRWSGRFEECAESYPGVVTIAFVPRRDVKLHLCGQVRAKDSNVRQAIIDRFGGKEKAIGRKASPGPLYGIKADCWQALALALTFADSQQ